MKEISMMISENFAVDEADEFREKLNNLMKKGKNISRLILQTAHSLTAQDLGFLYQYIRNVWR